MSGAPLDPSALSSVAVARRWPAWYTIVLLCGAAVLISYIDRTNISVAAIPMQAQFGWSETTKGWVLSAFFVGYLAFMAASGALANRYGGKLVLGAAVLWWSAFTMLTPPAAMISLPALITARIALGLGEAAVFPASVNMIGRWVPAANRTRAVALFTSMLSIGTMISLPVTGWLVRDRDETHFIHARMRARGADIGSEGGKDAMQSFENMQEDLLYEAALPKPHVFRLIPVPTGTTQSTR